MTQLQLKGGRCETPARDPDDELPMTYRPGEQPNHESNWT